MKIVSILLLTMLLAVACEAPMVTDSTGHQTPVPTGQSISLPDGFDIQGHRGARGLKPENTLPAFETALDLGVTTLELDLHYTADGVVVVWHDPDLPGSKCVADENGPEIGSRISNLPFEQLQRFQCDRNPDSSDFPEQNNEPTALAGDNYQVVSLEQLFAFVDDYTNNPEKTADQRQNAAHVQFNIETKRKADDPGAIGDDFDGVNPGSFERAIVELIEKHGLLQRVIMQSFDHRSLWAVRQLNPDIRLAALTSRGRPDPALYAQQGATIWSPRYRDLTSSLLETAHEAGLLVNPWTVNDPAEMQRLIELGVDGLITDRPDLLLSGPSNQ
ncbi:MAG: glycerophosphodiester phosphodiesterase family protein [Chloroflexota bacterium]|nr:glycerophosphodiester phosphodiesterase family protein [Chloroflexota bacterium]